MLKISFYLNGNFKEVNIPPELTLLQLIRDKLNLSGTKESCTEGDCGACTVIIASKFDGKIIYNNVNSCIYPAAKVHGCHVITVEGVSKNDGFNPVQESLYKNYAVQCGFCTPGLVLSMISFYINKTKQNIELNHSFLDGNLCRCTGYKAIKTAFDVTTNYKFEDLLPEEYLSIEEKIINFNEPIKIFTNHQYTDADNYYMPLSLNELWDIIKRCEYNYKLVNGATDVGVEITIRRKFEKNYIDISKIPELNELNDFEDYFEIGGSVTFQRLKNFNSLISFYPVMNEIFPLIASQQIRNVATIAGNIANASPIADFPVLLLVLDAKIKLVSKQSERILPLKDFYLDYKKIDLKKGEIIKSIIIEKHKKNYFVNFIKSSKRVKVDISTVNSAVAFKIKNNRFEDFVLAYGGVAKFVKISEKVSNYFISKRLEEIDEENLNDLIREEFQPISDVRGSDEFRYLLMKNQIFSHLHKYHNEK